MCADQVSFATHSLLRLRVTAEADAGAVARVLERFQNLNILPRRVIAEFGTGDILHVQVDITGLDEDRLTAIAAKIAQVPCVLNAFWHHV
jgi:(p)ppGpp synthase/HD superfamily hydrolase